jgi:TRAP-type C4-dicarboxylate transport system permease small subunit
MKTPPHPEPVEGPTKSTQQEPIALIARLRRGAELIAALLFAIMLGAFLIQVFTRYVLNDPASWTLEVCSIAYVWIVFFASAVIVDQRQHITFDMLYKSVNPRRRRVFAVVSTASILVMFAVGLPGTLDYIAFMSKKYSLMLHIRMDLLYSCFGLFVIGAIVASALRLRRLFGHDWKKEL